MDKIIKRPQKFTEFFGLKIEQDELNFLDIYAHQDIALFLDPFGISAMGTKWSKECKNQIATYFQYLLDSIKVGDKQTIKKLLSALHEVNEVALGYSQNGTTGRGIGPKQAKEIQFAFETSEAAISGDIKDIADCALLIPGINRDKISDITSNILKKQLIEFTKEQCDLYSIPRKRVAISAFDFETLAFKSYFDNLPVVNGKPKILLPISSVRQDPELSKDKYYRNFVLEFLRAEHSHAGDSLASVLKNGTIKVTIADLKKTYPMSTDFLYDFTKKNPRILEKYKDELRRTALKGDRAKLEPKKRILTTNERIEILKKIQTGTQEATNFHKITFDNLIEIFGNRLYDPQGEVKINEGRKRIDIVFNNNDKGFFHQLNTLNKIHCPKIFVECKNYGKELGNPEIDQLQTRFSKQRGMFGILLCRTIENKEKMIQRCKDVLHDREGYIIVLEDKDIEYLLKLKEQNYDEKIDQFMNQKLDEIIM